MSDDRPVVPAKERKLSQAFANTCAWMLSQHLKKSTFYFTYCHALRAGHIGLESGLTCSVCKQPHEWLPIDRNTTKLLANLELPEDVASFIDRQMEKAQ